MAYDHDLKRIVLFGGNTGIVGFSDTWTWDGATWSQVNSATVPDRYSFGMGYDPLAHGLVMFGGFSACCGIQGDTWKLVEMTFNDPIMYARPFKIKFALRLVPDSDIIETYCNENEKDRAHIPGLKEVPAK
jgi:hypothetical protein